MPQEHERHNWISEVTIYYYEKKDAVKSQVSSGTLHSVTGGIRKLMILSALLLQRSGALCCSALWIASGKSRIFFSVLPHREVRAQQRELMYCFRESLRTDTRRSGVKSVTCRPRNRKQLQKICIHLCILWKIESRSTIVIL